MRRFIITGAPGAGKTVILRQLELDGFGVVEEAATDVIAAAQAQGTAEPWKHLWFVDAVAKLQRERQIRASHSPDDLQFHDRSAVCTAALAVYLGFPSTPFLSGELERIHKEAIYEKRAFFVRSLGFIMPSEARRISFVEAQRFERIHEEIYRDFGFDLFYIEPGTVQERVDKVKSALEHPPETLIGSANFSKEN